MEDELIAMFGKITTNDHDTLVETFCKVLQVDVNISNFFLEAANWNVEMAVHNYLQAMGRGNGEQQIINPVALTSSPQAIFAGDLAPWQSRPFQGGTILPIRVKFQNTGQAPWPPETYLSYVDGARMNFNPIRVSADPGCSVEVVIPLRVPDSEGTHMGTWRLMCNAGYFGDPLYMIVNSHPKAQPVSFANTDFIISNSQETQIQQQQQQVQLDQLMSMADSNLSLNNNNNGGQRFCVGMDSNNASNNNSNNMFLNNSGYNDNSMGE